MKFVARSTRYVPLLDEGHADDDANSSNDLDLSRSAHHDHEKRREGPPGKVRNVPWTLVVVVLCTLLNLALAIFPSITPKREAPETVITRQNVHLLRRPNQYIGFDDIPRPTPPVSRQLSTYPILLSLVDAALPDTVFDDDFAAQMVHSGTITPDDRRVRVTSTMSTIVQFRAIDWGMEICELHVDLPESYGRAGHTGSLAIHRLNATVPLDGASLSYDARPPRVVKLGNILLGSGVVTWHRKFSCVTDEVLSFELSCTPLEESGGDSGCFVEWVQIKDKVPAIHMVQHSTA